MQRDLLEAWPKLADELRRLRAAADLSTRQLAQRLGWSQSRITKLETGRTVPTAEDVAAWATATGAADQISRLTDLVSEVHTEVIMLRARQRAGLPVMQRQTAASERGAMALRVYAPTVVPGLLQTPEYARLVVTSIDPDRPEADEGVAERMRRQSILWEPARRFEFVLGEPALRWRFGPAAVQAGQLDRIRSFATLANILVGVLPLDRATPAWHTQGFTLFEDRVDGSDPFVHVEAPQANMNIAEPGSVKIYQQIFDRLREAAVSGDEVQVLLARVMDELGGGS